MSIADILVEKIDESIRLASMNENNTVKDHIRKGPIPIETRILNVSFLLGQYYALLDVLLDENFNKYSETLMRYGDQTKKLHDFCNEIYELKRGR